MKSDYLHNSSNYISVLERQRAHLFDPFLLNQSYFPSNFTGSVEPPYHSLRSGWPDFLPATVDGGESLSISPEKLTPSTSGSGSFKKRKFDNGRTEIEDHKKKRKKTMRKKCEKQEDESKTTEHNNGSDKSLKTKHKDNKNGEFQKTEYIHVRARRGQATDSHSLAERVRREKISERMKYLQDLVPGCTKITGKAGMLDEIINYVQSLQRQVEFLSMKLAAVNPRLDFNVDDIFTKEIDAVSIPMNNFHENGAISSQEMFNTVSDPVPCFNIGQAQANSMWVSDLQNIYSNIGV